MAGNEITFHVTIYNPRTNLFLQSYHIPYSVYPLGTIYALKDHMQTFRIPDWGGDEMMVLYLGSADEFGGTVELIRNDHIDLLELIGAETTPKFEFYKKKEDITSLTVINKEKEAKIYTINGVTSYSTVEDVKLLIDHEMGLSPHRQRLYYGGVVLENQDRLMDFFIGSSEQHCEVTHKSFNDTFHVEVEELPMDPNNTIGFRISGKEYEVEKEDTLSTLIRIVGDQIFGIDSDVQFIITNGDDNVIYKSPETVDSFHIEDGDELYVQYLENGASHPLGTTVDDGDDTVHNDVEADDYDEEEEGAYESDSDEDDNDEEENEDDDQADDYDDEEESEDDDEDNSSD